MFNPFLFKAMSGVRTRYGTRPRSDMREQVYTIARPGVYKGGIRGLQAL